MTEPNWPSDDGGIADGFGRRVFLRGTGAVAIASVIAGCTGGDGSDGDTGANDGTADAAAGTDTIGADTAEAGTTEEVSAETEPSETGTREADTTGSTGEDDGMTMGDGATMENDGETAMEGRSDTPAGDTIGATTEGGTQSAQASIRTPGPDEQRDWNALAMRDEAFNLPEAAPTAFGFARFGDELTISYGAMTGSPTVASGTVYVLFVGSGGVEDVVVWETPIEEGEEFAVGPDGSIPEVDAGSLETILVAWENGSDIYVVSRLSMSM